MTFYGCQGASPSHYDPPTSLFGSVRRVGGDGDERLSPRVCPSMNVGSVLCAPVIVGYEWVRDSVTFSGHTLCVCFLRNYNLKLLLKR